MNKVFIAFLSGIAIGILIAPDKGSRTREKLSDGLNGLADTITDLKEKLTPELTDIADKSYAPSSVGSRM